MSTIEQGVMDFDGRTISEDPDAPRRLTGQMERLHAFLTPGRWVTIAEVAEHLGCTEQGASARIRDCRKPRHGAWEVERRLVAPGLFEYRKTGAHCLSETA